MGLLMHTKGVRVLRNVPLAGWQARPSIPYECQGSDQGCVIAH